MNQKVMKSELQLAIHKGKEFTNPGYSNSELHRLNKSLRRFKKACEKITHKRSSYNDL